MKAITAHFVYLKSNHSTNLVRAFELEDGSFAIQRGMEFIHISADDFLGLEASGILPETPCL